MAQHQITHVIFDCDGILLDTETIFYDTNARTLEHFGLEYNRKLKQGQMGRTLIEGVEWLIQNTELLKRGVTVEEYLKVYNVVLEKMLETLQEMPGVVRLINHLHSHNICTGTDKEELKLKTRKFPHIVEKIPLIVTGCHPELKRGKPHPDPYLLAIKQFPNPPKSPKNVLVFEDSVNGVYSALAAECTTVMIPQEEYK